MKNMKIDANGTEIRIMGDIFRIILFHTVQIHGDTDDEKIEKRRCQHQMAHPCVPTARKPPDRQKRQNNEHRRPIVSGRSQPISSEIRHSGSGV